jgi:hypothetical protein
MNNENEQNENKTLKSKMVQMLAVPVLAALVLAGCAKNTPTETMSPLQAWAVPAVRWAQCLTSQQPPWRIQAWQQPPACRIPRCRQRTACRAWVCRQTPVNNWWRWRLGFFEMFGEQASVQHEFGAILLFVDASLPLASIEPSHMPWHYENERGVGRISYTKRAANPVVASYCLVIPE